MTIKNTQPLELNIISSSIGYTYGVLVHAPIKDEDALAKVHWLDGVAQPKELGIFNNYLRLPNLEQDTTYQVETAIADAMVTDEMIAVRSLITVSSPISVTSLKEPDITSYTVEASHVDIGVAPANLVLNLDGAADTIQVQFSPAGANSWTDAYYGTFASSIIVPNLPEGTLDIRAKGRVSIADNSVDESPWTTVSNVTIENIYEPPEAATNIGFEVAKLAEPAERYDVRVSWGWAQGSGSNIREFVLQYIPTSVYDANPAENKWEGATLVNTGAAQSTVITNHPYDTAMKYRIGSLAWGPIDANITYSAISDFIIDENTTIDNDFVTQTGVEVNYAHIKGLVEDSGEWKQTFLLDAATGSVAIGLLDDQGKAPISFDPLQGIVNVDGSVISEDIIAANFILANLDGDDSPQIRTTTKETYGDPDSGFFLGYVGGKYKFDLGDAQNYIRYNGDTLYISGNVVIGDEQNSTPIGNSSSFVATIYKNDTSLPATPTSTTYPPAGWSTSPSTPSGSEVTYLSTSRVSEASGELVDGESWSVPASIAGGGSQGLSVANVVIYTRSHSQPTAPDQASSSYDFTTQTLVPPTGWTVNPESSTGTNGDLYSATALVSTSDLTQAVSPIAWGTPSIVALDGAPGPSGYRDYRWGPTKVVDGTWTDWVSEGGVQRESDTFAQSRDIDEFGVGGTPSVVYAITGQPGSGWYTIIGRGGNFPDDATATNDFSAEFGRLPTLDDHLTYVDVAQPASTTSETKRCNSLRGQPVTWSAPTLVVNGDTLVNGTISGEKLIAKTIKGEQISSETTIIAGLDSNEDTTSITVGFNSFYKGYRENSFGTLENTDFRGTTITGLYTTPNTGRNDIKLDPLPADQTEIIVLFKDTIWEFNYNSPTGTFQNYDGDMFLYGDQGDVLPVTISETLEDAQRAGTVIGINGYDDGTITGNPYKDIRLWAGTATPRDANGDIIAPVYIDKEGKLTATGADITGHINAETLTFVNGVPSELQTDHYAIDYAKTAAFTASSGTSNQELLRDGLRSIGSAYYSFGSGAQYIQADLGQSLYVAEVRVYFYAQDGRIYNNPKLEVSEDGVAWTEVWAESSSRLPGTGLHYSGIEIPTVMIADTTTRYLRIHSEGNTVNTDNHVYEVEILSSPPNADSYSSEEVAAFYTENRIYPSQSQLEISGGGYTTSTPNQGWGIHEDGSAVFNGDVTVNGGAIRGATIIGVDIYGGSILDTIDYNTNGIPDISESTSSNYYYQNDPAIPLASGPSISTSNAVSVGGTYAGRNIVCPFQATSCTERRGNINSARWRWGKIRASDMTAYQESGYLWVNTGIGDSNNSPSFNGSASLRILLELRDPSGNIVASTSKIVYYSSSYFGTGSSQIAKAYTLSLGGLTWDIGYTATPSSTYTPATDNRPAFTTYHNAYSLTQLYCRNRTGFFGGAGSTTRNGKVTCSFYFYHSSYNYGTTNIRYKTNVNNSTIP